MKTPDQILADGLNKFYALRPRAQEHIDFRTGNYWHLFAAQRAQIAYALSRVGNMLSKNSLEATGADLVDFINSEYTQVLSQDLDGTRAIGSVTFVRSGLDALGNPAAFGVIPKGTRLSREAGLAAAIPYVAAEYETTVDCRMDYGAGTSVPVPIRAVGIGAKYNQPKRYLKDNPQLKISGTLFDTTIITDFFYAAGGSDPIGSSVNFNPINADEANEFLRTFAVAFARGQYGPTRDASIYGAIRGTGGRHALTYDDPVAGVQNIVVADSSWASSPEWCASIEQSITDAGLVGFGCRINVIGVENKVVSVSANVTLRDWAFVTDTSEIDKAIAAAVQSYFDDRPDFSTIRNHALKNAISRAHSKILKCSAVTVAYAPDSSVIVDTTTPAYLHYYLTGQTVNTTYTGPG